jgi:hypothetical protein
MHKGRGWNFRALMAQAGAAFKPQAEQFKMCQSQSREGDPIECGADSLLMKRKPVPQPRTS